MLANIFVCYNEIIWLKKCLKKFRPKYYKRFLVNILKNLSIYNNFLHISKAATRGVLWKKVFIEILQNSQENICARVSFLITLQEISKNIFFTERLWTTASAYMNN